MIDLRKLYIIVYIVNVRSYCESFVKLIFFLDIDGFFLFIMLDMFDIVFCVLYFVFVRFLRINVGMVRMVFRIFV